MRYLFNFLLAVLLTSLSYLIGTLLTSGDISIWQATIIGLSVVSLGAITEQIGAPMGIIILIPFPVGMFLLYLFLRGPIHIWFLTYLSTILLYTIIHIVMSYTLRFHSLIPAWKLRKD